MRELLLKKAKNTKAKGLKLTTGVLYNTAQLFCGLTLRLRMSGRVFLEGKKI